MRQVKELQEFGAAPGPALLKEGMEELEDDPFVLLRCMGVAKDGWLEYNAIGAGGAEQMSSLGKLEGKMIEAGAVPGSWGRTTGNFEFEMLEDREAGESRTSRVFVGSWPAASCPSHSRLSIGYLSRECTSSAQRKSMPSTGARRLAWAKR